MWPQIIKLLQSQGMSQAKVADRVGVDQSTICRLADGRSPEPRYSVGEALIALAGGRESLAEHGIVATTNPSTEPAAAGV
jgi:transcriptional regulator with XRE-family HTH domain